MHCTSTMSIPRDEVGVTGAPPRVTVRIVSDEICDVGVVFTEAASSFCKLSSPLVDGFDRLVKLGALGSGGTSLNSRIPTRYRRREKRSNAAQNSSARIMFPKLSRNRMCNTPVRPAGVSVAHRSKAAWSPSWGMNSCKRVPSNFLTLCIVTQAPNREASPTILNIPSNGTTTSHTISSKFQRPEDSHLKAEAWTSMRTSRRVSRTAEQQTIKTKEAVSTW
mmetsp:Transcript_8447/g.24289  ORF Transcript_8447/g.24289 Transcript_8447/m.24289 type:complete len:221 (-) Transcript_8447:33-695(-)